MMAFWREVGREINKILSLKIVPEPKFFLLGLYPEGQKFKRKEQIFIDICLLQAKRVIALTWKSPEKPSITHWFKELCLCLPLEKITYILKKKEDLFLEVWGCFIQYIKNNNLSHLLKVVEED